MPMINGDNRHARASHHQASAQRLHKQRARGGAALSPNQPTEAQGNGQTRELEAEGS